jgi:hypothetical protein
MVFSDTSGGQGLIQDITFLLGTDTNGFTIKDRTRSINSRYSMVLSMIFESYGGWQFIDDNTSDASTGVPYADTSLVSGTGLYTLPASAIAVNGVEILVNSQWKRLKALTLEQLMDMGGEGRFATNSTPVYYMLQGDVIRLLPIPNSSVTSGLRIYFDQDISTFAITDTTKVPGFASPFHRMLSIGASLDYAMSRGLKVTANLQNLWSDYEFRLRKFYAKRWKDRQPAKVSLRRDTLSWLT